MPSMFDEFPLSYLFFNKFLNVSHFLLFHFFSRPWLCYWILHSLALLGESMDTEIEDNVVDFLSRCQVLYLPLRSSSNLKSEQW